MTSEKGIFQGRYGQMISDRYLTNDATDLPSRQYSTSLNWAPSMDRDKQYKFQQYDRLIKLKNKKEQSFNPTRVLYGQKKFVAFEDDMVL